MNNLIIEKAYALALFSSASAYFKQKFAYAHRVLPTIVYPKTVPSSTPYPSSMLFVER